MGMGLIPRWIFSLESMMEREVSDRPLLRESFVCHADILGWSERSLKAIRDGTAEEFLQKAQSTLKQAHRWVRKEVLKRVFGKQEPSYQVRTFTDNVVVSQALRTPDYDAGEPEFAGMLWVLQMYQALLSSKGFPVRGGIAAGMHYMDRDFAFGDALVEAVRMEEPGSPPRIVLAPSVMRLLGRQLRFYGGDIQDIPHYNDLLMDGDGVVFLNYLSVAFSALPDGPIWLDLLSDHKEAIQRALRETVSSPRVNEKYRWMAGYHNFVCDRAIEATRGTEWEAEGSIISDFLIGHVGFPQPQVLPPSLKGAK